MTAREYFEQLRDLESRLALARARLDQVEARIEGLGGAGSPGCGGGDASWRVADRLSELEEARARWAAALDGLVAREDEAVGVIGALSHGNGLTLAFWRQCLWLRYLCGRTHREIAGETGRSEKAVERALSSALDAVDAQGLVASL